MDNKFLIILAVVAAVSVAGGAYFLMSHGDPGSFSPSDYPDSYLTVLGNAEADNVIDTKDVNKIQALIDSKESIDYKQYYMYDANFDGKIDSADVEFVGKMIAALGSADPASSEAWKDVGTVHYVNVDKKIAAYDMTKSNKVITLIAPPLDSVLAMGGKDLVVGFDNRITTGKFYSEYAKTFDYSKMYDVGSCTEPSTEVITNAAKANGSVNVVCGTAGSYGPNMESTFEGTNVQVIRIASWEYGGTMYGFMTLGFLLKMNDGAAAYYEKYKEISDLVDDFVKNHVPDSKKAASQIGAAACYGYTDELSLLGKSTGEYANLMLLDPYDSAESYLNGAISGGHGDTLTNEGVSSMYQSHHLRNLILMIGTPFQVKIAEGDAQSSQAYIKSLYDGWESKIGLSVMPELSYCVAGYSFSSGVADVLNRLVLAYFLYPDEFVSQFGGTHDTAKAAIGEYVDWYCGAIGIDDLWSFDGSVPGTLGMNLLYCGEGDERNMMYGPVSGSTNVDDL